MSETRPECVVCGWQDATRKGRCQTDYRFWRRNGRDRTVDEVMRHWYRVYDKRRGAA